MAGVTCGRCMAECTLRHAAARNPPLELYLRRRRHAGLSEARVAGCGDILRDFPGSGSGRS